MAWLAGPAGLLIDSADGALSFTHLSFQEYLAAWHLDSTLEGEDRLRTFKTLIQAFSWRETLLLWAARLDQRNKPLAESLIEEISSQEKGYSLAGAMFADGLGRESAFRRWARDWGSALALEWPHGAHGVARSWAATSHQENRKSVLAEVLGQLCRSESWQAWNRIELWYREASLPGQPRPPTSNLLASSLVRAVSRASGGERSFAVGRILCADTGFWPKDHWAGYLHAWPSLRRVSGLRLQALAVAGCEVALHKALDLICTYTPKPVDPSTRRLQILNVSRMMARRFQAHGGGAQRLARDFQRFLARDIAASFGPYMATNLSENFSIPSRVHFPDQFREEHFSSLDAASRSTMEFIHNCSCRINRTFAHDVARMFAESLGFEWPRNRWLLDLANLEIMALGRVAAPAVLAGELPKGRQAELLSAASKATDDPSQLFRLETALERHGPHVHEVWPALARHLARRADDDDRALLESLARDPFQVEEGPLRWALRYIVRGDILLESGDVVTLDALCDELGHQPLAYLEDPAPPFATG